MAVPRKSIQNFIATDVDDEVVLIDMAGGELFSLKGSARAIWDAIDGKRSVEEIAALMEVQFDVQPSQALIDVKSLASELSDVKLLEL